MNTLTGPIRSQVDEAIKVAREHEATVRSRTPEYTVVALDPAFTGEPSIGVYARTYEPTWSFVESYDGTDAEALAAALGANGSPVTLVTDRAHLLRSWNVWQQFVTDFDVEPTPAQRLESKVARLMSRANAYDREWASNDRWGPGPGGSLREQAKALQAEIDALAEATEQAKRKARAALEPPKGWYASG